MFNKTIYKRDSKGKIRFLTIFTDSATIHQDSGVEGGENPVRHSSVSKAKNVGRANETTPEQQADLEAASKIETKMTTGYFETVDEAKTNEVLLPMLAKEYKKESKKIDWTKGVYVQPKLDGIRALGQKGKQMISRKGKSIDTMSHIEKSLNVLIIADCCDGELYKHGASFQENVKLIKKYRGPETEEVKYHVYDMLLPNLKFSERNILVNAFLKNVPNIEIVPTYKITSEKELKEYHKKFLAEGYEGTIIRHGDDGYAINKRDSQLLKYKDFLDLAAEIVDIVPSDKNPKQAVVHCKMLKDDRTFGCGMKFSHKEREDILSNRESYLGKTAEIRFFEYTDDGLPRFPVCVGFREDK